MLYLLGASGFLNQEHNHATAIFINMKYIVNRLKEWLNLDKNLAGNPN